MQIMNDMEIISKDYVGVVSVEDNKLKYSQVPIKHENYDLIDELGKMLRNPDKLFSDMYGYFMKVFPMAVKSYNYCYPAQYIKTYVLCACIDDREIKKINELREKLRCIKNADEIKKIKEDIDSIEKDIKLPFFKSVQRYIFATNYYNTEYLIRNNRKYVMWSTENIGWTQYDYSINEDISCFVRTNFCFGSVSYFFVNLMYKGIELLPYSAIVTYYYANMIEFVRYTRKFWVRRESWYVALNFVVDIANKAIENEKEFIEEWIPKEIEQMMGGLRDIDKDAHGFMQKIIKYNREESPVFRNISANEIEIYKVHPQEMEIAFKAEKITGALFLLEKLTKLKKIYPRVVQVMKEIKEMNKRILPVINDCIDKIEREIKPLQKEIDDYQKEIDGLEDEYAENFKEVEAIREQKYEAPVLKNKKKALEEYDNLHPDFKKICDNISDIESKIYVIEKEIKLRRNFSTQLEKCKDRIVANDLE